MKQMDKKDGMSKTVTVVIPIYNVEKYLNRCIESVAGQTYKNLETCDATGYHYTTAANEQKNRRAP